MLSMRQARDWNPSARFVVLASSDAIRTAEFNMKLEFIRLKIVQVPYDDLLGDPLVERFKKVFFISGSMGGGKNPSDFNERTSLRMFILHAYLARDQKSNYWHLENDNMVYFNASIITNAIEKCNLRLGMEARRLKSTDADRTVILGTVFIKQAVDLKRVLEYVVKLLEQGKAAVIAKLGSIWVNDMSLFGDYYYCNTLNSSRMSGFSELDNFLTILPEGPSMEVDRSRFPVQACLSEQTIYVFDNAALAIWNYGTFQDKKPFSDRKAWGAYSRMDARKHPMKWERPNGGLAFPVWRERNVASLHVHSKELERVLSNSSNLHRNESKSFKP